MMVEVLRDRILDKTHILHEQLEVLDFLNDIFY